MGIDSLYNKTSYFYQRNIVKNDIGGQTLSYSNVSSCPCYITRLSSSKQVFAGKENVFITNELTCGINNVKGVVTTDMVCSVDNIQYDIIAIDTGYKDHHIIMSLSKVNSPQLV
jgi:hypothetical protein